MSQSFVSESKFPNGIRSVVRRCLKSGIYFVTATKDDSVIVKECFGIKHLIETETNIASGNIIFA